MEEEFINTNVKRTFTTNTEEVFEGRLFRVTAKAKDWTMKEVEICRADSDYRLFTIFEGEKEKKELSIKEALQELVDIFNEILSDKTQFKK